MPRPLKQILLLSVVLMLLSAPSRGQSTLGAAAPFELAAGVGTLALDDAAAPVRAAPTDDFAADSWVLTTYGSARFGDHEGEMYLAHVGIGYYLFDGIAINAEFIGGGGISDDDSAGVFEFELLGRWHFLTRDNWSLYIDGALGVIQTSRSFPESGTHSNFTTQVGIGGTFDLADNVKLMLGVRYLHLSNAGHHGQSHNPSWDGAVAYLGVMIPF